MPASASLAPSTAATTVAPGQLVSSHSARHNDPPEEELPRAIGGLTRTHAEDECSCGFPSCHSAETFRVVEQSPPLQFTDLYTQVSHVHMGVAWAPNAAAEQVAPLSAAARTILLCLLGLLPWLAWLAPVSCHCPR